MTRVEGSSAASAQAPDASATLRDGLGANRTFPSEHIALIEGVQRVADRAAARSAEIDAARAFPQELYDEVHRLGAFYALAPRWCQGLEAPIAVVNELVYRSARANGSMGWLMMVGTSQGVGHGFMPEGLLRQMQSDAPRPKTRGALAPKGRAVPVDGGYRVSGRWPFASGGPNPDFVSGNCIVFRDGKPSATANGAPEAIFAVMAADQVKFIDTWHVLGMRGTDSCDVEFDDVFVAEERAYNIFTTRNLFDTPLSILPLRVVLSMGHVAVALGIAQGALDDIVELAKTKAAAMNPNARLQDDPVFNHALGENHLRLRACKAMLNEVTESVQAAAEAGRQLTPEETLTGRTMSAFVTFECVKVVDWAYTAGGSTSVYDSSSLQRRFRDIHVATQHASCHHTGPYRVLGRALLGEELSPAELF